MAIHLKPAAQVSDTLKEMLNDAIAREMAVSIQYMCSMCRRSAG